MFFSAFILLGSFFVWFLWFVLRFGTPLRLPPFGGFHCVLFRRCWRFGLLFRTFR